MFCLNKYFNTEQINRFASFIFRKSAPFGINCKGYLINFNKINNCINFLINKNTENFILAV